MTIFLRSRVERKGNMSYLCDVKRIILYILVSLMGIAGAVAQQKSSRSPLPDKNGQNAKKNETIKPHVRAWKMIDQYTLADTIPVDTLTDGHQINNKIWKNNVMNVTLGNLGSPYLPMFYLAKRRTDGNMFYNTIQEYLDAPDKFEYYNTKTPYTNLAYTMGYPKRRSEEFVQVLFTQNVNKRVNVGIHYKFSTSIGRYESQRSDHASVRLFSSMDGDVYGYNFSAVYNRSDIKENGGVINDNYIMYPDSFEYDKADDVPVQFMDQNNRHSTYQILYAHHLDLAYVERMDKSDSSYYEVPVATAYHQIHLLRNHHEYKIINLANYSQVIDNLFPEVINDNRSTRDSIRYSLISNTFNLKLSEEFNSLMRFGLRAYIGNEIRHYQWPDESLKKIDEDDRITIHYRKNKDRLVNAFIGGQVFKNRGENFRMNAGLKFYFVGYNKGDLHVDGSLNGNFHIGSREAQLWAKLNFDMRNAELWEEKYCSNHYRWNINYDNMYKKTVISGGLKIPSLRLELTGFSGTENSKIYFGEDGKPAQKSSGVEVYGVYLYKHSSVIGFNMIDRVAFQKTSDDKVEPLPMLSLYTSNYYENLFFNVLTMQIGFDWRYNTEYYAPKYLPATMQFVAQSERKVGNYHYIDPFVNFQLKRARIYVKYEHVNSLWGKKHNYFHTIHYPANPGFFKFGLSWNFYD